ncbi:ABC transporter ATP-binding protein [Luedemannella helvata]|uniref:ABC transporter ATP-binding protein n=2 Tax=Luedemannella helvata TaxID=349315 RepID=A0ABP4X567_9ACTN
MNLMSVRGVNKTFNAGENREVRALDNVNLTIEEGEFLVLLGPSGCGKTTLLRLLGGLESPTSGSIEFESSSSIHQDRSPIGFVFQEATLMPWRTALSNVELSAELSGIPAAERRERGLALLDLVGLSNFADKYPRELSGGMQQRVSLARALAHDPPLLLMDEPFGALDAQTRDTMNVELQRIWLESRKTAVFVTHSIQEAVFLADRIVLMATGPGRIQSITEVNFPRPRTIEMVEEPEFREIARKLRLDMGAAHDRAATLGG